MKIVLRKKNSVTSIVLFIFNMYGEFMKKHCIKLGDLIEMMLNFGKSETAIRMGLSRLVKAGILINRTIENEVYYELTVEGIENIDAWNLGIAGFFERYKKRQELWDEKWYLLNIFNFNKSDIDNQHIVEELKELGMGEVNSGLWISPYDISEKIDQLFKNSGYHYMEVIGDVRSNINIVKQINEIYDLNNIRKKYEEFIKYAAEIQKAFDKSKSNKGKYLEILFELGWKFYEAATLDPALPKSIIKDWEGDEAVRIMNTMRSSIVDEIKHYLNEMNEKY